MRTTLNIDEAILNKAMSSTHAKTKTQAISRALKEIIRKRQIQELKRLSGRLKIYTNWKKLEDLELKEFKKNNG